MINVTAAVNSLGYGTVGRNILLSLENLSAYPAWWPIGPIECEQEDIPLLSEMRNRQENFDGGNVSLKIWHQFQLAQHIGRGKRVAWPFFELDRFKSGEINHLKQQDEIVVSSKWAEDVLHSSGIKATHVVPCGVDNITFAPRPLPDSKTTRFLVIGKWEYRKGHDAVKRTFEEAFRPDDDVELWMHCYNPCLSPAEGKKYNGEWEQHYQSSLLADKIKISRQRLKSHKQVADLMREVDCGVFLSRAEGWNLEALEMMATGRHVIVTGNTAHLEFCNAANSLLVPTPNTETAIDGVWFKGDGYSSDPRWAEIGMEQIKLAASHMRDVYETKQKGKLTLNQAGIETARVLTWENSARRLIDVVCD